MAEPPARVSLLRTGGIFAGNVVEVSVDEDKLGAAEAAALRSALAEADLPALARESPLEGRAADAYQYELELDRGGRRDRVVVRGVAPPPERLRPLIRLLERRAGG